MLTLLFILGGLWSGEVHAVTLDKPFAKFYLKLLCIYNRKQKSSRKAAEIQLVAEAAMLRDVNDDEEVRKLIHNMMEMDGGTMMKNIYSICIAMFQEKYNNMKSSDR